MTTENSSKYFLVAGMIDSSYKKERIVYFLIPAETSLGSQSIGDFTSVGGYIILKNEIEDRFFYFNQQYVYFYSVLGIVSAVNGELFYLEKYNKSFGSAPKAAEAMIVNDLSKPIYLGHNNYSIGVKKANLFLFGANLIKSRYDSNSYIKFEPLGYMTVMSIYQVSESDSTYLIKQMPMLEEEEKVEDMRKLKITDSDTFI